MGTTVVSMLALGFLLGVKHAIETDHVAAVATIVSEQRSVWRSSLVGAVWGVGHTCSLLLAGMLILGLHLVIPERVELFLEFLVGVMLVGLGLRGIRRAARGITVHRHAHGHDDGSHAHLHLHIGGDAAHDHGHVALSNRSFWIGLMHGLAGSGTLTVLVLATVPSVAVGLAYILVFGIGSVLGMVLMSALIGLPIVLTAGRFRLAHLRLQQVVGVLSVATGAMLAWEVVRTAVG